MKRYYCYRLWDYLEPDVSEIPFENDQEAIDFWLRLADKNSPVACTTITRVDEVNGVFYENFVATFKRSINGLDILKSHAL